MKKKKKRHIAFVLLRRQVELGFPEGIHSVDVLALRGTSPSDDSMVTFNNTEASDHRCTNLKQLTAK